MNKHTNTKSGSPSSIRKRLILVIFSLVLIGTDGVLLAGCSLLVPMSKVPTIESPRLQQLTDDAYLYESPAWSPDGKRIAVTRNRANLGLHGPISTEYEVVLIDLQTGKTEVLSHQSGWAIMAPAWSPDGKQLAVIGYDRKLNSLLLYSIDSQEWTEVECSFCEYPTWSSDGMSIYVAAMLGAGPGVLGEYGLLQLDPVTGQILAEYPLGEDFLGPYTLASDETEVVLATGSPRSDCEAIWRLDLISGDKKSFIDDPNVDECDPALSPRMDLLAYTMKDGSSGATNRLVITSDLTNEVSTLIAPNQPPYEIHYLSWSPDGKRIAFAYGVFNIIRPAYSDLYVIEVPEQLQAMQ
jgi:Tol biopolymer transport system component